MRSLPGRVMLVVGSSLSSLSISCHSLLPCRVSAKKSAVNLMGVPLYVICRFSLATFNNFSIFNFCRFDYYVSRCVSPWVDPVWDSLRLLDLGGYFLSHVREVFDYNLDRKSVV